MPQQQRSETMAQSAYDLYKKTYDKKISAINAQDALQTQEKADREAQAQKNLDSSNRGTYTTYKNAINPYGVVAAQNNLPTGVSEYMQNAAYGTMLQGLGANQNNFQEAMNNSNSLWYAWLADKAGMESDALSQYNSDVVAQKNYDAEQAEDKRRYDQDYDLQKQALQGNGSSGNGSGGVSNGTEITNDGNDENETFVTPTAVNPSGVPVKNSGLTGVREEIKTYGGNQYKFIYDANGRLIRSEFIGKAPTTTSPTMTTRGAGAQR